MNNCLATKKWKAMIYSIPPNQSTVRALPPTLTHVTTYSMPSRNPFCQGKKRHGNQHHVDQTREENS